MMQQYFVKFRSNHNTVAQEFLIFTTLKGPGR